MTEQRFLLPLYDVECNGNYGAWVAAVYESEYALGEQCTSVTNADASIADAGYPCTYDLADLYALAAMRAQDAAWDKMTDRSGPYQLHG